MSTFNIPDKLYLRTSIRGEMTREGAVEVSTAIIVDGGVLRAAADIGDVILETPIHEQEVARRRIMHQIECAFAKAARIAAYEAASAMVRLPATGKR